jgi:hypothetical protein
MRREVSKMQTELSGLYFISFTLTFGDLFAPRQRVVESSGVVVGNLNESHVLIREGKEMRVYQIDDMVGWKFYATEHEMRTALDAFRASESDQKLTELDASTAARQ